MIEPLEPLTISSAQHAYSVEFDDSMDSLCAALVRLEGTMVLIDRNVALNYRDVLAPLLSSRPVLEINASENEKTLDGCARVIAFLQKFNATRQTQIIVLGGGVTQDIATFCTHVYYRGIKWIFAPTTLLGMADSCIGAKASINFNGFKNQLGVFHSPAQVRICIGFLDSLPETEIKSGYGEIVKLHLVASRQHFDRVSRRMDTDGLQNIELAKFIRASLAIKKKLIEIDEFDEGVRRTLNYGHTFGHALESITHHGIPHGLAVAWGMDLINYISMRKEMLSKSDFDQIHSFLKRHFQWNLDAPIDFRALIENTRRDKKTKDGRLTLALPTEPGNLVMVTQDYTQEFEEWVQQYLNTLSFVVGRTQLP